MIFSKNSGRVSALLPAQLRGTGASICFMHVFIDDSDTFSQNGFICLAGFIASDVKWDSFYDQWAAKLSEHGLTKIHTSDFLAGEAEYADLGWDYEQRVSVLQEFMGIVRENVECAVFSAVEVGEYRKVLKAAKKRLQPEEFIFRRVLRHSFEHMGETGSKESIQFWFDDNTKTSPRFLSLWSKVKKNWHLARTMLGSISFADDFGLPPLQAADLLANALNRAHSSGEPAWHPEGPFAPMFLKPGTHIMKNHVRGEIWEPSDIERNRNAILDLAKPS